MKRLALPLFSCLLVLTLLLGSFSTANAAAGDPPVVTPVSGDMEFTTEIIPIASLPGTTELANQMLVPVGFPAGEAQYEGAGVLVKGMDSGKATTCFTITGTEVGWGGKVGLWDGAKWVLLPTTITPPTETPNSIACATITGSGTYAFIRWIADPDKLPKYGECSFSVFAYPIFFGEELPGPGPQSLLVFDPDSMPLTGAVVFFPAGQPVVPVGGHISYQILNSDPPGMFLTGLSGTGVVIDTHVEETISAMLVSFNPTVLIGWNPEVDGFNSVTVRIFLPYCYSDFNYPEDVFPVFE